MLVSEGEVHAFPSLVTISAEGGRRPSEDCWSYRMCSSVTVKALQSGWDVLSQIAGFFSAATDVCPVIGAELMCRALAMADSRVSSLASGPTPVQWESEIKRWVRGQDRLKDWILLKLLLETYSAILWAGPWYAGPALWRLMTADLSTSSPKTAAGRQTDRQLFIWSSHWFLISFPCSFWRQFQI